jgi:pectate lyase
MTPAPARRPRRSPRGPGAALAAALALAAAVAATGAAAPDAGGLINISTQAALSGSDDPLAVGFVLRGAGTRALLVRGVGPTLSVFGVPTPLADPALTLHAGETPIAANDDWAAGAAADTARLAALARATGAFALAENSRDAALAPVLGTGGYSARLTAKGAAAGNVLVEVYDAAAEARGAGEPRLVNVSTLGRIGAGRTLTAGFVIGGRFPRRVLLRGAGPSLTGLGVVGAVADTQLTLFTPGQSAALQQNDNWTGAPALREAFAAAGAFAYAADNSRDAALIATLPPGAYTAQVSAIGTASGLALVEVYDLTPPADAAPSIVLQPASLRLNSGAAASLTVIARSSAPVVYQWTKDGTALPGATADTLWLSPARDSDRGEYRVIVTNAAGSITSAPAAVAIAPAATALPPAATFALAGFATLGAGTTGGGLLAPGDPNYRVLDASIAAPAQQLRTWLESTSPLVVDVQVDVDLGALGNLGNKPRTNPELMASGIGVINVRSNKTVFSSTGATLRHGAFVLSGQSNIIIRNLRFRGLWEFDEGSQNPPDNSPWGYKIQDWDYINLQNSARNVWIDHCDFEKSYDGLVDTRLGADLVTFSWCRFGGDTEGAVARQIAYLEKLYRGELTDSRVSFTFYRGLRDGAYAASGIPAQTPASIVARELPHDKTNLVGSADTEVTSIGYLNLTFHHVYYHDCQQRLPRMRFGNAHLYNVLVDNSGVATGANMGAAATCDSAILAENCDFLEIASPFPPVSGTSPPGRATQSGSRWVLGGAARSFAGDTFLKPLATWTWNTATRGFAWSPAPAPNAFQLPYSYRADPVDYTSQNLGYVGVIVPTSAADQAVLAARLVRTQQP